MKLRTPIHAVRLAIVLVSFGLSVSAGHTIIELWQRRDVVEVRRRELTNIQAKNISLQNKLNDMESDTYVERIARDQLGMIKEGETMIMMPQESKVESQKSKEESVPNWKKWWRLFF